MAKCLMLDVDGVLVDGRPDDGLRWDHRLSEDMGISPDDLGQAFFAREWNDIVVGKKDLLPALSKVLANQERSTTADDLVAYWFEKDSRIAVDVLSDCRAARQSGVPVYLTTNQEHMRATYLMKTMGLEKEVDGIVYSAQAGYKKPQREFFDFAQRTAGCAPHDLLLVDDTPDNVKAARQAGWNAVHWDGSERLSNVLARSLKP